MAEAVVHRISVEMALAGGIFEAMSHLGAAFSGIESKVDRIHTKIGNWKGAFALIAGAAGIGLVAKGMDDLFKQMEEYQEKITGLRQLGLKPGEERAVRNEADRINAQIRGTTPSGIMQIYRESRDIIGPEESLKALEAYSKFARALADIPGHSTTFEKATERLRPLIKASDIMGYMTDPKTGEYDAKRHQQFLDTSFRAIEASGGMIDENRIFGIASKGGISLRGLSPKGLMEMFAFSEIMGGQQSGTAMMSMFQQFAGGTMFTRVAKELEKLKILGPKGDISKGADWDADHGRVILSDKASGRLGKFFQESPLEGMQVLKKTMIDAGITDPAAQQREIFKLLQRATTQRFFGEGLSNMQQMLRQTERMEGAETVDQAIKIQDTTSIKTALSNVAEAYHSLLQVIGEDQGGIVVNWITRFADSIRSITEAVKGNDKDWTKLKESLNSLTGIDVKGLSSVLNEIDGLFRRLGSILSRFREWLGIPGSEARDPATGGRLRVAPDQPEPTAPQHFNWRNHRTQSGVPIIPNLPSTGVDDFGRPNPINFVPPAPKTDIHHNVTAINIDGTQVATLIDQRIAQIHELPDSASSSNGVAQPHINDWNTTDTMYG